MNGAIHRQATVGLSLNPPYRVSVVQALPPRARLYIWAVSLVGIVTLGLLFPRELPDLGAAATLAFFFVLVVAADLNPVVLAGGAFITVGTAINLTNAILFGPGWAVALAAASVVMTELMLRRPWYKIVFNSMGAVVWTGCAAIVYQSIYDPSAMPLGSYTNVMAILAYTLVHFTLNTAVVSTIIGLAQGLNPLHVWAANYRGVLLQFGTMSPLGVLIAETYRQTSVLGAIVLVLPLIIVFLSFRTLQHLREQTLKTVEALADAVDRRDAYTAQHSEVVADYSRKLALKLGLPLQEIDAIVLAARVHDLGKIAVPDSVLLKPGKLDADEWETMQEHPTIGADILGKLWLYRRSREFVLHHQERFDGKGYPTGIAGEQIPLGARIIAVVDAYQAMTSDRPYRRALPFSVAVRQLTQGRGTQFDPKVVDAFIPLLEEEYYSARFAEVGGAVADVGSAVAEVGG